MFFMFHLLVKILILLKFQFQDKLGPGFNHENTQKKQRASIL